MRSTSRPRLKLCCWGENAEGIVPAGTHAPLSRSDLPCRGISPWTVQTAEQAGQDLSLTRGEENWGQKCGRRWSQQLYSSFFLQLLNQQLILSGITCFVPLQWLGSPVFHRWVNLKPQKIGFVAKWLWFVTFLKSELLSNSWMHGMKPLYFSLFSIFTFSRKIGQITIPTHSSSPNP